MKRFVFSMLNVVLYVGLVFVGGLPPAGFWWTVMFGGPDVRTLGSMFLLVTGWSSIPAVVGIFILALLPINVAKKLKLMSALGLPVLFIALRFAYLIWL